MTNLNPTTAKLNVIHEDSLTYLFKYYNELHSLFATTFRQYTFILLNDIQFLSGLFSLKLFHPINLPPIHYVASSRNTLYIDVSRAAAICSRRNAWEMRETHSPRHERRPYRATLPLSRENPRFSFGFHEKDEFSHRAGDRACGHKGRFVMQALERLAPFQLTDHRRNLSRI